MMEIIKVKAKKLVGLSAKLKGLMFEKNISPVYLETRFGIHTFFVATPIDILVLGENNIVKNTKEFLMPLSLYFWDPRYFRILELPSGFIKKSGITIGTKIDLNLTD